nr:isoform 2 of probable lrr receptor-like serine/threonine-protein kinase [Quercus suber]POF08865.1 isoform 2 of probable lrr receptor-like serine/threonine-protein kinase [Quercus suber]
MCCRGYMAPEYALWGYLTYKADVYSFGVVALEIVAGKNNIKYRPNEKFVCLLDWATVLQQRGDLIELVDPELGSEFSKEEVLRMIKVALLCTNTSPALRPTMTAVVSMLEGQTVVDEVARDPGIYGDEWRFEALRDQFGQSPQLNSVEDQGLFQSANPTWIGSSSTSAHDLYPTNLDSRLSLFLTQPSPALLSVPFLVHTFSSFNLSLVFLNQSEHTTDSQRGRAQRREMSFSLNRPYRQFRPVRPIQPKRLESARVEPRRRESASPRGRTRPDAARTRDQWHPTHVDALGRVRRECGTSGAAFVLSSISLDFVYVEKLMVS